MYAQAPARSTQVMRNGPSWFEFTKQPQCEFPAQDHLQGGQLVMPALCCRIIVLAVVGRVLKCKIAVRISLNE